MADHRSPMQRLLAEHRWGPYQTLMDAFRTTCYHKQLEAALDKLDRAALYMSHVHGLGHIERTMLHGAMCAAAEGLDESDTALLMDMCSYHDTGRNSDWLDNAHGYRSSLNLSRLTGREGEELRCIMAGVEAHSLSDRAMQQVLEQHAPADMARARRLAELLKDSDGLDRVRINDLNPKFLRREASRQRADFAQYVFERYSELEEPAPTQDGFALSTIHSVKGHVSRCFEEGRSCAQTALLALGNLTGVIIPLKVLKSLAGEREICGLLEAGMTYLTVCSRSLEEAEIAALQEELRREFAAQYGGSSCSALCIHGGKPGCAGFSVDGILFAYQFMKNKKIKIDGAGLF